MKISLQEALEKLKDFESPFINLFDRGTLSVELYKPEGKDLQQPHPRDEVYIVILGSGIFYLEGSRTKFSAGDFLFVPAGEVHRFEDFTDDFVTCVIFFGPEGGEQVK